MNEELQSTNDELQEINDALRLRTDELDAANSFLGAVLRSLGSAVVVVDQELRVQVWGPGADEMWGIRPDEAKGHQLLTLDIGLPVREITPLLKRMLGGQERGTRRVNLPAVNRRGRAVQLEVECCLLLGEDGDHQAKGAILVMNQATEEQ
jgi:two-component system CheB/CheR fusion protein